MALALTPQFDHGGALGAYQLYAPWGDTLLASMYGTGAAAMGSEPTTFATYAAATFPEPFPAGGADASALSAGRSLEECKEECRQRYNISCRLPWPVCGCIRECEQTGRHPCGPFGLIPSWLCEPTGFVPWLIGAGLILVGAVALTR